MPPKRRWYQKLSGRFEDYLEAALASDDARRRNLAWVMLDEIGGQRGAQHRFAERTGWSQSKIQQYVNGTKAITDDAVEYLANRLERPIDDFVRVCHPLGFPARGAPGAIEPGDPQWEGIWAFFQTLRPGQYQDAAAIRKAKPHYFPE